MDEILASFHISPSNLSYSPEMASILWERGRPTSFPSYARKEKHCREENTVTPKTGQ
jgi:hypothetical protein